MFSLFRSIFFPSHCLACNTRIERGVLCDTCRNAVILNQTLFCGSCRARLPEGRKICHNDFPYFLGAAGNYDDVRLRTLIHEIKFRRAKDAAESLAEFVVRYLGVLPVDLSRFTIIPVPLSPRRMRERGFNQSELIAQKVSETIGIPLFTKTLFRPRHTRPQSETENVFERRLNVRDAFRVSSAPPPKNILLLDDVTTSGATFRSASSVLKSAGARKILAIAVAKA